MIHETGKAKTVLPAFFRMFLMKQTFPAGDPPPALVHVRNLLMPNYLENCFPAGNHFSKFI